MFSWNRNAVILTLHNTIKYSTVEPLPLHNRQKLNVRSAAEVHGNLATVKNCILSGLYICSVHELCDSNKWPWYIVQAADCDISRPLTYLEPVINFSQLSLSIIYALG